MRERYIIILASLYALVFGIATFSALANSQTVNITSWSGQIANFFVSLPKTNSTPTGIYSFHLLGSYLVGNVIYHVYDPASYTNCTITDAVNCQVVFVISTGSYNSIEIFNDGIPYETLTFVNQSQTLVGKIPPVIQQVKQGVIKTDTILYVGGGIVGSVISILLVGNLIYYKKHKGELKEPPRRW